jgi:hypothetical protein
MKHILSFFLIAVALVFFSCAANKTESPKEPNQYKISFYFDMVSNNSVGNDWIKEFTYDGIRVRSGEVLTLTNSFSFRCKITEDDASPDVAYNTVSFSGLQIGETQEKTAKILVTEDKGRYAGNKATWEVIVTVERLS